MKAFVEAPNLQLYRHWLDRNHRSPHEYPYLARASQLSGYWGSIIVLNGGSMDSWIRSLVNHPSRRARVTHMEV